MVDASINDNGHLILTMSDGAIHDLGVIEGTPGLAGVDGLDGLNIELDVKDNAIMWRYETLDWTPLVSVPLPFNLEKYIETTSSNKSLIVEQSINSIIDTTNPGLRKDTVAYCRDFFKLTVDQGLKVFNLVEKFISINS